MMNSNYGEKSREVLFSYTDQLMKEILVHTNSNSAFLKFYIPLDLLSAQFPLQYKEIFEYDSRGNILQKKVYLGEELMGITKFEIEYYP